MIPSGVEVFVALAPFDMRSSFDRRPQIFFLARTGDEALLAVPGVSPRHVKALCKAFPATPAPWATK